MLFRISGLLALAPVSRALFGHSTQELFKTPLLNSSDDAKDVFTTKIALEIPRIQAVVASPSGTYAALLISELSLETDKTAHTLQIVNIDASSDAPSLKLEIPAAGEIFWYDDSTVIFGITDSVTRTTSLYAHYVSLVTTTLPPGELVGILPTDTAANFHYSYPAQALVFSDYVFSDGDLSKTVEHDRAWEDRKDTALTYDGSTYTRIFNKYYGPKRLSLFSVRLTVDFNGRWELAQDYVNLLAETGHHSPVEGILGPREHFSVSGLSVVYTAKDPLLPEAYHNKQNVYLTDIFGQTSPRELTSGKHGATSMPVFSPGEQKIAWLEQATDGNEADKNYVVIFDVARNSTVTLLKDWDRSPTALSFSPDGLHLYMTVPDNARVKIFTQPLVQSPSSRPLEPTSITQEGAVSDLQALPGGRILFKQQSMGNPGDACVLDGLSDAKKTRIHKLTHFARDSLSKIEKPEVAEFTFKGAEGRRVHGLIVKPVGWTQALSKKKTWPVVFAIHGGPEFFTGDMWSSSGHPYIFSHHGYFFVAVNPTGSTSFGRNLTKAIIGDWGGAPFEDLRKGFKHALRIQPEIDSSRAVAWGASYGGYAINWIQSNPGFGFNFTALACFAGIFDLRSFAYAIDQNYFMNYEWTGRPWEESVLEKFAAQSPSNFVHRWSTPELVIHGDIDFRVPVTEGLAAFSALQQRGVPSRLVIFKEESHGITKPHNLVIYYEELFRWFDHFVGLNDTVF